MKVGEKRIFYFMFLFQSTMLNLSFVEPKFMSLPLTHAKNIKLDTHAFGVEVN